MKAFAMTLAVAATLLAAPAARLAATVMQKTHGQTISRGLTLASAPRRRWTPAAPGMVVLARAGRGPGQRTACAGRTWAWPSASPKAGGCCTSSTSAAPPKRPCFRQGLGESFWTTCGGTKPRGWCRRPRSRPGCWLCCATEPRARAAPPAVQHRQLRLGPAGTSSPTSGPSKRWPPPWARRADTRRCPGLADVQGLPAHHAEAPGRSHGSGARWVRTSMAFDDHPPETLQRPHRDRDGRFRVRLAATRRPGRRPATLRLPHSFE